MSHLRRDELDMVNQSLGHLDLPIYLALITFLWGPLKNFVHAAPFDSEEDLVARISKTAARMHEIPGIFKCVHQLLH
ncbi:uncharacterized protein TNCV_4108611 [Trichonephila clavipes]|nr:uncharacterized protein TNCV_4108611 [Trichonephila clavipes]